MRQNPPPDVPTAALFPALAKPSAIRITAISFSGCTTVIPRFSCSSARKWRRLDEGVMGYET